MECALISSLLWHVHAICAFRGGDTLSYLKYLPEVRLSTV